VRKQLRAHLGESEVSGTLTARVASMPPASRNAVEAMACLGGRAEVSLLQTATDEPASLLEQALTPALDDGLLVVEPGPHEAARFRHDRLHEATLRRLDREEQRGWHLAMARRLAAVPDLFAVAAERYVPVVDAVDDPAEQRRAVELLRRAADQAGLIDRHALVNDMLAAALRLVEPNDTATLIEVHTGRHRAPCHGCRGRPSSAR
jgi:hypothetical protein